MKVAESSVAACKALRERQEEGGSLLSFLLLTINSDGIVTAEKHVASGDNRADWSRLLSLLAPTTIPSTKWHAAYVVFEMRLEEREPVVNKLLFISFIPDHAPLRQKLLYASSKEMVKSSLGGGICIEVSANSPDLLGYDTIAALVRARS